MRTTIFILFFTLTFSVMYAQKVNKNYVVVIDAGHGGYDSGTSNKGYKEKDINLYVAKFVSFYLEKYNDKIEVILTREKDTFISLKRRPIYAKITNAKLFVSIHCNHNQNDNAKGIELYIQNTDSKSAKNNIEKAIKFGKILEKNFVEKLNFKSRGILKNNFQVLRESIEFTPSILIEMGFFSNKDEASYLSSKKGIKGLSLSIAKSIIDYFNE